MSAPRRINAAIARQAVFWATTIIAVSFRLFVPSTGPVEDAFSVPLALFERAHLCNTLSPLRGSVPQRLLFSLPRLLISLFFPRNKKNLEHCYTLKSKLHWHKKGLWLRGRNKNSRLWIVWCTIDSRVNYSVSTPTDTRFLFFFYSVSILALWRRLSCMWMASCSSMSPSPIIRD
jgi:hypothetical protein